MKHRKRLHRRELKRQRKIIVLSLFAVLLCLSIGYATFSTNINMSAKGNISTTPSSCFTVSDNGDGTGTITDYDASCGSKVKIPNQINNLTITKIGNSAFDSKGIKSIIFPNTLIYIGSRAFHNNRINFLEIPSSVKEIGDHAFAWTGSFSDGLILHEGLETIGGGAFELCGLKSLKIPSTVKNLYHTIASANSIEGDDAFIYARDENGNVDNTILISYGNSSKTEVVIPDNIKKIVNAAFVLDGGIKKITIPDSVTTIQAYAFWAMDSLTEVNIGSGIVNMDRTAFYEVPNLTTININLKENTIEGSPWGATSATVNWMDPN